MIFLSPLITEVLTKFFFSVQLQLSDRRIFRAGVSLTGVLFLSQEMRESLVGLAPPVFPFRRIDHIEPGECSPLMATLTGALFERASPHQIALCWRFPPSDTRDADGSSRAIIWNYFL